MTETLPQAASETDLLAELEQYRVELRGYCYRMLGSTFDADDAVQDTFVKAWQALDRFEGRSSLRSWLYRIATNVCLDSLRSRSRRALPMDLSSPVPAPTDVGAPASHEVWVEPALDGDVVPLEADPARRAVLQDSVRLAFVAALQQLPPRQRAVLVLREVLGWHAAEVAELLGTTVASVNSALQRARATLGDGVDAERRPEPLDAVDAALLARYVAAFEAYDIPALVAILHEEASISMPPFPFWMKGSQDLADFYLGAGKGCEGSRLVPLTVNGAPAFAHYKPSPEGGLTPWSVQVLEVADGEITHVHHFLDVALFPRFGLPARLTS